MCLYALFGLALQPRQPPVAVCIRHVPHAKRLQHDTCMAARCVSAQHRPGGVPVMRQRLLSRLPLKGFYARCWQERQAAWNKRLHHVCTLFLLHTSS